MRSAEALERLGLVRAVTPLSLVALGTFVVQHGTRRLVDPHWFRGVSSLTIGWNGVTYALRRGYALLTTAY